jgi:hypothetical protein
MFAGYDEFLNGYILDFFQIMSSSFYHFFYPFSL